MKNLMIFEEAINTRKSNEILNFSERHQPNVASICVFANQENQQFEPGCSGESKSHMKLLEIHCLFGQVRKAFGLWNQKFQYLQGPVTKIEMVVIWFCHATFFCLALMKTCSSIFERGCSEEHNSTQNKLFKTGNKLFKTGNLNISKDQLQKWTISSILSCQGKPLKTEIWSWFPRPERWVSCEVFECEVECKHSFL